MFITSPPGGVQSIVMSSSVFLIARISQKPHGRTPKFLYMLRVTMAQSSSDGIVIH